MSKLTLQDNRGAELDRYDAANRCLFSAVVETWWDTYHLAARAIDAVCSAVHLGGFLRASGHVPC